MTRTRHLLCLFPALLLAGCASTGPSDTLASVVDRFDIVSRTPAFAGAPFEGGGEYETIVAVAHMRINPRHPLNRIIADIDQGGTPLAWISYQTDVVILRPREAVHASRALLVELPNRGGYLFPVMANDAVSEAGKPATAGNGFTMRRGHTLAWIGWQGDVPLAANGSAAGMQLPLATRAGMPITGPSFAEAVFDNGETTGTMALAYPAASLDQSQAALTVRAYATAAPVLVARSAWRFEGASAVTIARPGGVDAGAIYRFDYQASNPRLMGLGMAAVRDVTSFLKSGAPDGAGQANPLSDIRPNVAIAVGVSQSGRVLRDLIWQGFNQDPAGGKVFDGAMPLIAGSRKSFVNVRFGQPGRYSTQHLDHVTYGDQFPFSYAVTTDPVSGRTDGIFARCQATATCPKLMHVDSSVEFWQGRASLVVDNGAGKDIALPNDVRAYLMSSTQHMAADRPFTVVCKYPSNPARQGPAVRVLLDRLVDWARSGKEPPASRYPRHADSMLTQPTREAVGFPDLAGVDFPAALNELIVVDYSGESARAQPGLRYNVQVPMVDVDGNDIAGIRLPDVAVPLATYTGWNLRRRGYAEGQLCGLNGMHLPFPASERVGDSRRAIAQRYASRIAYAKAVALAARELRDQGLLLQEDVERYIERAKGDTRVAP
ncbi:alpha/beta hydrolase domain-containing protein [Massilia sp. TWP1-3-3]|uniref:alpha/beta hydrolase domain-containing protein n=1 Tax=Massilia sp. TWP1-3-3 TaxID=2804573 RepID=UPI003CEB0323